MSRECGGCLTAIPNRERLHCCNCQLWYDLDCANISPKAFKCMSIESMSLWICVGCRNKLPKGDNTNIPVRSAQQTAERADISAHPSQQLAGSVTKTSKKCSPSKNNANKTLETPRTSLSEQKLDDIANEDIPITRKILRDTIAEEIGSSLKNLALEQLQLREIVDSFQQAISFFSNRYEELKVDLEQKSTRIENLEKENITLQESLHSLNKRVNITEQYARASNVEIQCVPENKSENLVETVLQLSKSINCDLKDTDIQYCTRVAKKISDSNRPRSILVKLNSPRQRDTFLAAAIKYNRNNPTNRINTSHLRTQPSPASKVQPVYVVEHLSAENKHIHGASRARARELGFKFVWVRNGRVFVKKSEESDRIFIDSIDKLASLY